MRPFKKTYPIDNSGEKIRFSKYGEAKPFLIEQTGRYCHFCEIPVVNSPAVEHIKPNECENNKNKYKNLRNRWENLLLICTYCNSRKGNKDVKLSNYYWPFKNNTLLAFNYFNGLTTVQNTLLNNQRKKAQETIKLYGLDKMVDSGGGIDTRYEHRLKALSQAIERYDEYNRNPPEVQVRAIVGQAIDSGFFSVWFQIFNGNFEVKRELIDRFKIPQDCIDNNFSPIPRNPNNAFDPV